MPAEHAHQHSRPARTSATPAGNFDQSDAPTLEQHLPEPLPADPFPLFVRWFEEARTGPAARVLPNPNAMSLATLDPPEPHAPGHDPAHRFGRLSTRIVLCKGIDAAGGSIVFYTNYLGRKGRALTANPRCALAFHWDPLDRQVRMEGLAFKTTDAESDAYFASRPWISRIGAWTSDQSEPIASRAALAEKVDRIFRRFGIDPDNPPPRDATIDIPRPPHWGGFRITVDRVELWVGATGRLHDRAEWVRELRAIPAPGHSPSTRIEALADWRSTRLQP